MEWATLLITLCFLEAVLGLDNIFSFAMLVNQAPSKSRKLCKIIALGGAFVLRLLLLLVALWVQDMDYKLTLLGIDWSVKGAFLFLGGLFLIMKAVSELRHYHLPKSDRDNTASTISSIIAQVMLVDFIFAIDSVLAAVAMTQDIFVIICSIISSIIFMYFASDFVIKHMEKSWRFNILGMILIICIGIFLIGEGLGLHIDKQIIIAVIIFGCIYESYMTYLEHKIKAQTS